MNWSVAFVSAMFVFFEALVSFAEGTLSKSSYRKPKVSFFAHAGMWGDFLIFPFINGLIWDHLHPFSWQTWLVVLGSLLITLALHVFWASNHSTTGHMWPNHKTGKWYSDMSMSGWLHVIYMTCQLSILILYALNPMPYFVVVATGVLLTIFWPLGVIQPAYAEKGVWMDKTTAFASVITVGAIWGVSLIKIL